MQDGSNTEGTRECPLVRRAVSGDAGAFAALCEKHRKRVWRVAASVTRSAADADDLAQEAFVRAFGAVRSYRPEASFEAWLCRIALNAAHDYQKSAWRRRVLLWSASSRSDQDAPLASAQIDPAGDTVVTPHQETERREIQRRVRAAVAELKPTESVPIWMIYFEEFTLAEVARLENTPESTIRSRVRAGMKRLEKKLGDLRVFVEAEDDGERHPHTDPAGSYLLPDKRDFPLGPELKGCVATCP
ncbi:MAG: RNA polymerase sigma factor [Cytophagales bacterium]|nr:RNA polymerase sigma factor [Armatimonadota bacterium]